MQHLCILLLIVVGAHAITDKTLGTSGAVTINEGSICGDSGSKENKLSVKFINKHEKALNWTLVFPSDVTDKWNGKVILSKWTGIQWGKGYMKMDGPVCEKANSLLPGVYERVSKHSTPKMGPKCPFKKGKYIITNFINRINSTEMRIPTIPYGRFRLHYELIDPKKTVVLCFDLEMTITRK